MVREHEHDVVHAVRARGSGARHMGRDDVIVVTILPDDLKM